MCKGKERVLWLWSGNWIRDKDSMPVEKLRGFLE